MPEPKTISVTYKCQCMDDVAGCRIQVPARLEHEDLEHWMEYSFGLALSLHHEENYPNCQSTVMEWVKMPTDEHLPLGAVPTIN